MDHKSRPSEKTSTLSMRIYPNESSHECRWHQTCVSSSSHKTTSSRTPKGKGSSTLGTERTTSSPSFTEPSWSDVRFFLQLSTCPSPRHQLTAVRCSSGSRLHCLWFLPIGTTSLPLLLLFLPQPVGLHIYKLRLGL